MSQSSYLFQKSSNTCSTLMTYFRSSSFSKFTPSYISNTSPSRYIVYILNVIPRHFRSTQWQFHILPHTFGVNSWPRFSQLQFHQKRRNIGKFKHFPFPPVILHFPHSFWKGDKAFTIVNMSTFKKYVAFFHEQQKSTKTSSFPVLRIR